MESKVDDEQKKDTESKKKEKCCMFVFYFSGTRFKDFLCFTNSLKTSMYFVHFEQKLLHCAKTCTLKKRTIKAIEDVQLKL